MVVPYYPDISLVTIWTMIEFQAMIIRTPPDLEVSYQDSICAMLRRWVARRWEYQRSRSQYTVHPESPHAEEAEAESFAWTRVICDGVLECLGRTRRSRGSSATAAVGGGAGDYWPPRRTVRVGWMYCKCALYEVRTLYIHCTYIQHARTTRIDGGRCHAADREVDAQQEKERLCGPPLCSSLACSRRRAGCLEHGCHGRGGAMALGMGCQ